MLLRGLAWHLLSLQFITGLKEMHTRQQHMRVLWAPGQAPEMTQRSSLNKKNIYHVTHGITLEEE